MGGVAFVEGKTPLSHFPESRVLIIMTGGTICMQPSEDGLVPMTGFLKNAMAPRPSFNDKSAPSGMSTEPWLRYSVHAVCSCRGGYAEGGRLLLEIGVQAAFH
jgi:hypothetical protein